MSEKMHGGATPEMGATIIEAEAIEATMADAAPARDGPETPVPEGFELKKFTRLEPATAEEVDEIRHKNARPPSYKSSAPLIHVEGGTAINDGGGKRQRSNQQ